MSNRTALLRLDGEHSDARQDLEILRAGIVELAPVISRRAAEIEAERRVPNDLLERLRSIGVFRLLAPRSHGGMELDLPTGLEIIQALGRIDGSVGWIAMIGNGVHLVAPLLPHETYQKVYRDGPDARIAVSIQPAGTAEQTEAGWRVSGRWPFASGCVHADWMAGLCVMKKEGRPLMDPADERRPLMRCVFMPARDWEIEDTWHAAGLEGTASHHIVLRDKLAPEEHFSEPINGKPCLPGPLYQTVAEVLPLFHDAFSLGVAEGAVDDVVQMAATGRQQFRAAVPMRESEIFQAELGRAVADLRAAKAFGQAQVAYYWRRALAGTIRDQALVVEAGQASAWIAKTCADIGGACFVLGGGSAVYDTSPLQRRLRDLHVAAQHAAVHRRNYIEAGKLLLAPSQPYGER